MTKTTEAKWRALIREQERSGLSMRDFAAAQGVSPATIYWWRSRLGQVRGRGRQGSVDACELVSVAVSQSPAPSGEGFELQLCDDLLVRIPRGFASDDLRRILDLVRTPC